MKKLSYIIVALAFLLSGCGDNFFDINQNPNKAVEENMTPSLVFPRTVHRLAAMSATDYDVYSRWMGYWARCSGTYGPNTDEESYAITSSFNRTNWLNMYDILKDLDVIEKNAEARNETGYQAIAKILKSIGFMQLVDQYNNVPYSKAFNLGEYMLTPYDKGPEIYAALIADLEVADNLLKEALVADNLDIRSADIVYGGDFDLWRKLGNTQRLRLVMHQSELLGDSGLKTEIDKIVANGGGFLAAGETAEVQPGYAKDVDKQNPYWNSFKINDAGGLDNFNRANNYLLEMLMTYDDVRYEYFYSKAATPTNGEDYVGFDYGHEYPPETPENEKKAAANSSDVAGPGIAKSPSMAQWLFTSFESMFLQAEAIQRGALSGNAKTMYEDAVTESYVWLDVEDAEDAADAYLNAPLKTFAVWDQNEDKLKLILTQKYIAMFGINGLETWTDYRRTGIPNVPLSIYKSRGSNVIPKRMIYPQEEYQYNSANATAEGTINPQTATIFWDK
ncbi:SusD/RagB family nutrient-binding outer membrane lipoprotein [Maribellus sp. YY47]|uniref:SusD/RagB family nutrient-binding outer membrane lipoprotein n=1 Tax=Maribellus sp. YY47 TaxID=2929486 RepID=UPI002000ADC3|nr:SusD/RagB family nutrient-binding outer membrane lipoprotein [Maribellus sp. YY47]MCK3684659.1 SusD/RagB family nutrient-binding outer membrane lipoprotein [Maribellus sp. YY47]